MASRRCACGIAVRARRLLSWHGSRWRTIAPVGRKPDIIVIGEDGSIEVEDERPETLFRLRAHEGRYRLITEAPGVLILRRALPDDDQDDDDEDDFDLDFEGGVESGIGRVVMAGEVLTSMTLFQIVEVIGERNWQGDLRVFAADGMQFLLSFDQGALRQATSSHPEDRLGEVFLRHGALTRRQLEELLPDVTVERRLGQLCLERGLLEREQLFGLLQQQVKEIFFRTLLVADGAYVFTTPDAGSIPPAHTAHLSVRALLLEGIQRVDEMELFRQLIPANDVCLERVIGARERELDQDSKAVLLLCDGLTTLTDIARETGLGEFATTKAAYYLVKNKQVRIRTRTKIDVALIQRVMNAFNGVMRDIFKAIDAYGSTDAAREMLSAWVVGSGYATYLGERVAEDGSIDTQAVLAAVQRSREEDPLATLHQVAHELVSFALFCAGSQLPRDEELKLSRDVNRRLQSIRLG